MGSSCQVSEFLCCLLGSTVPFQDGGTEAPGARGVLGPGSPGTGQQVRESRKPVPPARAAGPTLWGRLPSAGLRDLKCLGEELNRKLHWKEGVREGACSWPQCVWLF